MTLSELLKEVSRRADTDKTKINAADVSRVIACMFDCLHELPPAQAFELVAKGMASAAKRKG